MTKIFMSTSLNVSADQVWKLIGGFNSLPDWHPAVEKSELTQDGQTRTLTLAGGGGTIVEDLKNADDGARSCTYSIVEGPLPVANYISTIKVSGEGESCTIDWSGEFDPAGAPESDARAAIEGIYQAGFDSLKERFGG